MLLTLLLINNFAIGLGEYPNGFISFKFNTNAPTVWQLTVGTSGWHSYGDYDHGWGNDFRVGGRGLFAISKGGNTLQYTHFLGGGAGIHSWGDGAIFVGEGFYEFELFPNPAELPLSFEIGLGLTLVPQAEHIIGLFIPIVGIHFYIK